MHRYALTISLLPLLLLISIAALNWYIDPYQIFSANRQGSYDNKPALHANMRLHKAFQVALQKPDAIILGSSKAIQGIPTDHALFDKHRVYNLAMPLASMKELTYLLRHANTIKPTQNVLLGLDFLSFNVMARKDGPASGFEPARLSGNEQSRATPVIDYLAALISLDALLASIDVIKASWLIASHGTNQVVPEYRVLTGLGGREDREIRSRLTDGGHRSNALKIEEFFTRAVYLPSPYRQFNFRSESEDSFYWFEQFVRTLHQNRIAASLFISPSHARLGLLIESAELWPKYELWKQTLLDITIRVAEQFKQKPYALWDFSAPGNVTTEPFPEAGDTQYQMRYYYESIHYNQHTGALVLDRLQSDNAEHSVANSANIFGQVLTPETIDADLLRIRELQKVFGQRFPAYRDELESIVEIR